MSIESSPCIDRQLGLAIGVQPDDTTLLVYRRLLTGFSLIKERNEAGFTLIQEVKKSTDIEGILKDHWNQKTVDLISALHGYWRTAILRLLVDARKKWAVRKEDFQWIESIDPVLHGAMVTAHIHFTPIESELLVKHFKRELEYGHACLFDGNPVKGCN